MVSLPGLLHLVSSNGEPSGLLRLKISGLLHDGGPSWAYSQRWAFLGFFTDFVSVGDFNGLIFTNGEPSWASLQWWAFLGFFTEVISVRDFSNLNFSNGEPSWASSLRLSVSGISPVLIFLAVSLPGLLHWGCQCQGFLQFNFFY